VGERARGERRAGGREGRRVGGQEGGGRREGDRAGGRRERWREGVAGSFTNLFQRLKMYRSTKKKLFCTKDSGCMKKL
jgi:hypothetical protein